MKEFNDFVIYGMVLYLMICIVSTLCIYEVTFFPDLKFNRKKSSLQDYQFWAVLLGDPMFSPLHLCKYLNTHIFKFLILTDEIISFFSP